MIADLPALDLDAPAFYEEQEDAARDARVTLADDLVHRCKAGKRRFQDARRVANATRHLGRLPGPGETAHLITQANWHHLDLLPAMMRMASPARPVALHVATYSFSHKTFATFIEAIEDSDIQTVTFIASAFYRSVANPELYDRMHAWLTRRGHRCAAVRTHAKVSLLAFDDDSAFVIEGSANLRGATNIEQIAITHDQGLLEFHRGWMLDVIAASDKRGDR